MAKPKIAVCSGPTATMQHSEPLVRTWETASTMHDPIALSALDLDGTLLPSDTTVSDRTLGAIDACRTQGLHIFQRLSHHA